MIGFGLFFCIQMIKITVELIETMCGRQELIEISQMVLAELATGVAMRLQQLGECWVFVLQALFCPGHSNGQEPGPERMLSGNKGCTTGGTALLSVIVSEKSTFLCNSVNVRRAPPIIPR